MSGSLSLVESLEYGPVPDGVILGISISKPEDSGDLSGYL